MNNNELQTFKPVSNKLLIILTPIFVIGFLIYNQANDSNSLSQRGIIISVLAGLVAFLLALAVNAMRANVYIHESVMKYRRKSVDLKKLASIEAGLRAYTHTSSSLRDSYGFRLRLVDRTNSQLWIPTGFFQNQEAMLLLIEDYAERSNAKIDQDATKLFEKIHNRAK